MKKPVLFSLLVLLACAGQAQTGGVVGLHRKSSTLPFNPALKPFYHGVASGDPLSDRVIIWTRVTPDSNDLTITVDWEMATDTNFSNIVKTGTATTDSTRDFTVKIDVTGLQPATTYYYVFKSGGVYSTVGRARTAPSGNVSHLRFAVVSCNNYEAGFFNAFGRIAERNDLDAVIHLGDYIYEYEAKQYGDSTTKRFVEPANEAVTGGDYRIRYSIYHLDPDLQRAHQQQTFISVWDDHESSNDSYEHGAKNHQPATEGDWETRKAISKKVYFEWMPIRDYADNKVYRAISYGSLAELIMVDTRLEGRDQPPVNFDDPDTPARTMLGKTQYDWFIGRLVNSTAKWKVVGNQVMFSDLNVGFTGRNGSGQPAPTDMTAIRNAENLLVGAWESYPTERNSIIDTIEKQNLKNVVILTGDSHASWAFDVTKKPVIYPDPAASNTATPSPTYNPATGQGSVAAEFCTPSITSANFDERIGGPLAAQLEALINAPIFFLGNSNYNPHLKYTDLDRNGYIVLDLKDDSAQAGYYYVDKINTPSKAEGFGKNAFMLNNSGRVLTSDKAPSPKAKQEAPAPLARHLGTSVKETNSLVVFHAYPNPARDVFNIQYGLSQSGKVKIAIRDISGKDISLYESEQEAGLYNYTLYVNDLARGLYFYTIETRGYSHAGRLAVE